MDVEPHSNDVRERKMTLKLHSRTPSLLQDHLASGNCGIRVQGSEGRNFSCAGFNGTRSCQCPDYKVDQAVVTNTGLVTSRKPDDIPAAAGNKQGNENSMPASSA